MKRKTMVEVPDSPGGRERIMKLLGDEACLRSFRGVLDAGEDTLQIFCADVARRTETVK